VIFLQNIGYDLQNILRHVTRTTAILDLDRGAEWTFGDKGPPGFCSYRILVWSSGQSSWLQNGDILCFLWGTNWICYVEGRRPPLWSSDQSSWLLNGDVLYFVWGTNWIYICYVEESRPPLWSSSQSSWLQIQKSGFDSRRYQIFWEVVGLERNPLSLVGTTEELLGIKSSCSGLETENTTVEIRRCDHTSPSIRKFGSNFADKLQSFGRYISLAN
jgi:hypothetical protein